MFLNFYSISTVLQFLYSILYCSIWPSSGPTKDNYSYCIYFKCFVIFYSISTKKVPSNYPWNTVWSTLQVMTKWIVQYDRRLGPPTPRYNIGQRHIIRRYRGRQTEIRQSVVSVYVHTLRLFKKTQNSVPLVIDDD